MSEQIVKGSTVTLKSGGPLMTVDYTDEYGLASCSWFDEKQIKRAEFQITSLTLEEDED